MRGVSLQRAIGSWYAGDASVDRVLIDDCGELPCTNASSTTENVCPHLPTSPLSDACRAALGKARCARGGGDACARCVHEHAEELIGHDCPRHAEPVLEWWCAELKPPKGHHVCETGGSSGLEATRRRA